MSEQTKSVLIVIGTVAYVICPLDGDFILVLGWLDDLVIIGLCIAYFRSKAAKEKTPEVVDEEAPPRTTRSCFRNGSKS